MANKNKDFDREIREMRILEKQVRQFKFDYVMYRNDYIDTHERLIACAYLQKRVITDEEFDSVLKPLYQKYIDSYFKYLNARSRACRYSKLIDWLRSTL